MVQLIYIVACLHVILCPFTKVEESFNVQAFHDILYHRHNLSQYDHNEFPGVVPRTFIGPLVISALSSPIVGLLHVIGFNKYWMQYVVRLTLALTVIAAWNRLRNVLQQQFGNTVTWWLTIITASQYHFMFYMSRPLPNIMVLPLVLLAYEGWLSGNQKQFIRSAGAAIIIFRSELAMLFGLYLIMDVYFKKIDMNTLLRLAVPAGLALVGLTIVVDSVFWGRLLWPEAEVFWYNTVLNKSSDWGTSPFLWYFYSALPRGLGPSLVLIPVGLYLDRRLVPILAPALVYILLYSILPHKELRFIIYVFPLLNIASAVTCSYVFIRRTKSPVYELMFWGVMMIIVGNVIMTAAFSLVAVTNYPGGVAIARFHKLLKDEPYVHVHISNLAAQTGVTRFTQIKDHWTYSKNESLTHEQLTEFTHLLLEAKSKYSPNLKAFSNSHVILDSIETFSQVAVTYKLIPPIKIKTKPALFILERKDFKSDPLLAGNIYSKIEISEVDSNQESEEIINVINYDNKDKVVTESPVPNVAQKYSKEVDIIPDTSDMHEIDNENKDSDLDDLEVIKSDKAKKALVDLKVMRQERKRKAIEKIKSETRTEVVASAKEKLREIMKRHKHIAEELSEKDINREKIVAKDARGDIPEEEIDQLDQDSEEATQNDDQISSNKSPSDVNLTNENVDKIVEEVIARLIDRKIYDDKTKPEDIKAEDRQLIQRIVEEVLSERTNYTKLDM